MQTGLPLLLFLLWLQSYNCRVMREKSANVCGYWSCNRHIRRDHFLCAEHFEDWEDGFVDECPNCGRFKDSEYELCLDCAQGRRMPRWKSPVAMPSPKQRYAPEHSKAWMKGDKKAERFFVYILKLDDGSFYVGQTRELRERISEHRDSKTFSTAGRSPRLQYFETLPSREAATSREVELKELADSNPREIRRIVIAFQDYVRLVQLD